MSNVKLSLISCGCQSGTPRSDDGSACWEHTIENFCDLEWFQIKS